MPIENKVKPAISWYEILQISDARLDWPDLPGIEAMRAGVVINIEQPGSNQPLQFIVPFRTTAEGPAYMVRNVDFSVAGIEEFFRSGYAAAVGYREMIREIHAALSDALNEAGKPGKMVPDELDFVLTRTNNSRASAAKALGVATSSIVKWSSGERVVNEPAARILRVTATAEDPQFSVILLDKLAEFGGEMNSVEFSLALTMLGLADAKATAIFGLSERTVENYDSGARRVNETVGRVLRVMVNMGPDYAARLSRLLVEAAKPVPYPPCLVMAA
jgi:DNA-binding transcriptional regulator YiaG